MFTPGLACRPARARTLVITLGFTLALRRKRQPPRCMPVLTMPGAARNKSCILRRQRLLSAFGDFLESLPARSEAKLLCIGFVCRLTATLLPGSSGRGQAAGEDDPETPREMCRWLRALPELLCRWGGDFPQNSAAALAALVEVAKHALPPQQPVATPGASAGGASSHEKGKVKGKTASAGGAALAAVGGPIGRGGPWAVASSELLRSIEPALLVEFFGGQGFLSLPSASQMDAISLLYHLPSMPASVVAELASACSEPAALDRDVRSFLLEVRNAVAEDAVVWSLAHAYSRRCSEDVFFSRKFLKGVLKARLRGLASRFARLTSFYSGSCA